MSMKSSKTRWCNRSLIQFPLWYAYVPDEKAWNREMKRLGVKNEPYPTKMGRMTLLTDDTGKTIALVTLNHEIAKEHTEAEVAALIAHESMHVWQEIMSAIGEQTPSQEFAAYALQTIFHELYSGYLETKE